MSVAIAATAKLQELREKAAEKARKGIAMQAKGCLLTGQGLIMGAPTFDVSDPTEYREWCASVTRKSWETCRQYIAIAKAHKDLTADAKQASEGWAFEPQQRLVATPAELREQVVAEAGSYPDVQTVEAIRDRIVAENMSPEDKVAAKAKEQEKSKRDKQRAEDKTAELCKVLAPTLNKFSEGEVKAYLTGAITAKNHPIETFEAAVKLYQTQKAAAIAKKAADDKKAAATKVATA